MATDAVAASLSAVEAGLASIHHEEDEAAQVEEPATQPFHSALPLSLAIQPFHSAFPLSLATQPCHSAFPLSLSTQQPGLAKPQRA